MSEQSVYTQPDIITESLFDDKEATLSEADIQRLLSGRIVLPDTVRVAVYKYGSAATNRYYSNYWYNEEYLKIQQNYIDILVSKVKEAEKVKKVILMPSLMTPRKNGMTQLRESAVRLQADLLLVFTVRSDIYYKYKMFKKDEAKAFATCEAILLDIRTGVVPHSSVITKEAYVKKGDDDWTSEETRKRAETEAVIRALNETGRGVADFLQEE